jgi:hypothetical protein
VSPQSIKHASGGALSNPENGHGTEGAAEDPGMKKAFIGMKGLVAETKAMSILA